MIILAHLPDNANVTGTAIERNIYVNGKKINPAVSQAFKNHSPDGFNWGYGGSGAAQTALAICMQFMSPEDALRVYQYFKFMVIANAENCPQGKDFSIDINVKAIMAAIIEQNPTIQLLAE